MLRWEKVENLASLFLHGPTPVIPKEVRQDNLRNYVDNVDGITTAQFPSNCNRALHLRTNDVEENASTKKVSFEFRPVDYRWLKGVEVSTPKSFLLRKQRRMFLKQVIASSGGNCNSNQENLTLYQ